MSRVEVCEIRCTVPHSLSPRVRTVAEECGIMTGLVQASRNVQIRERALPFLSTGVSTLEETRSDTFHLFVTPEREALVMGRIIQAAGLEMADRGTVFSRTLDLVTGTDVAEEPSRSSGAAPDGSEENRARRLAIVEDLACIRCIVPRGFGDTIARISLEMGTSVPSVAYGVGTGGRDRLGLLRIAISAEKEMVTVVTPARDAEALAQQIVENGRLDQPGTGFVYLHPVQRGLVNIRLWIGSQHHAATMNQLVAAVDALWGDTAWRRRFPAEDRPKSTDSAAVSHDLREITVVSPETETRTLLRTALDRGAGGATTAHVAQFVGVPSEKNLTSGALELTTLVVPSNRTDEILGALAEEQTDDAAMRPKVFVGPAPWVYSYRRSAR